MAVELRPTTALIVLAAVLAAGSIGSVLVTGSGGEYDPAAESIELADDERNLWLYTSKRHSFDSRTLAINVVVYEDPNATRRRLLQAGRGDWNETADQEQDVAPDEAADAGNATAIEWDRADGADRYVYLTVDGGPGAWIDEAYQVHDGDYLGSRHHVRAYSPPERGADWTALQAHHEYWDWFTLRHVVTSVEESQQYVEAEFIGRPDTERVVRVHVGGADASDFDGWVTVVEFHRPGSSSAVAAALAVVLLGATTTRGSEIADALAEAYPEREARALALAGGVVAVFMSVRLVAVELERALAVPPRPIAIALYPAVFVGLPVTAYVLSRHLDRPWAFAGATLGFLTAVLLDYTYLGIASIPLDVMVHRGTLAVALGLIAVGGSQTERHDPERVSHVRAGTLLWLVALVLPLLRFTPLPV